MKQVQKISVASEPAAVYYLQVSWEDDIGTGFSLSLSDGQSAWHGRVSEEDISKEAGEMEMKREKYVEELKRALALGTKQADAYSFDLTKDDIEAEDLSFIYEKVLKDVSFRLGSARLCKVQSPAEVIKEMIDFGLVCTAELHVKSELLANENERLLSDQNYILQELEKCVAEKEQLEQELFTRFVLVLNEKKAKIRSLQEKLKEVEATAESAKHHRDKLSTVRSSPTAEEADYDASTDDENSNVQSSISQVSVSYRGNSKAPTASLAIDNTSPDIMDIAPSRKRRQRLQKAEEIESKSSKQSAQQPKSRSGPAIPKSSINIYTSGREPSQATQKISEPEDLFENM
ncbi:DNA repair protein XRCC4 [Protopterus annectens]|uniref:DNA repair protein XRCC4 n=1 Tax=Protopterus annectens TaxID=7888 RepID=UPI001CF9E6BD|nr:DNA repair protein XRCC4 [Protopterus annectens]XP_043920192.1 DNA repair protein XRCC4 [Protopterus annectens]